MSRNRAANSGSRSGATAASSQNVTGLRSPGIPNKSGTAALRSAQSGSRLAAASAGTPAASPGAPGPRPWEGRGGIPVGDLPPSLLRGGAGGGVDQSRQVVPRHLPDDLREPPLDLRRVLPHGAVGRPVGVALPRPQLQLPLVLA